MTAISNCQLPYTWEVLMRYRLIEIIALWEGRLTTNHLCDNFQIQRQQASKDINKYNRDIAPDSLVYCAKLKGYKPTDKFKPMFTQGVAEEYLQALSSKADIAQTFTGLDLGFHHTHMLQPPRRQVDPEILRVIVQAARNQQKIDLGYVSLTSPDEESRIITPHTLICTPLRWHVRAYCEKNRGYRDFVLSRFRSINDIEGPSANGKAGDSWWNTQVNIVVKADPRLTDYQRAIVEHDYHMQDGALVIPTRGALVMYVLKQLNIDVDHLDPSPTAQQIVVANMSEIEPYIWRSKSV
ncbi:MAG TPA: WYL domain-containing protein [Rheinheimera sp.]|nr:WYL domain-containing protein [Rheinheimera sp.]